MRVEHRDMPGVLILNPQVFADERGFFQETFNQRRFTEILGREVFFVQDNRSQSVKNVLRGLHYQAGAPQAKLIWATAGVVFDAAVDLRPASPTYGCWAGVELSAENKTQLWLPEGLAHGFLVLSERAEINYKVNAYYAPEKERVLRWDDPTAAVEWPLPPRVLPFLSEKDARGLTWPPAGE